MKPGQYRQSIADALPSWYRGDVHAVLHFGLLVGLCLLTAVGVVQTDARWLWVIPVAAPLWSLVEYGIHRSLLHGTIWPPLTRDHAMHHAAFSDEDMFATTHRDLYRVLQRPQDVLSLEAIVLVAMGAMWLLFGAAAAFAIALSGQLWFLLYEVAHAIAHSERLAAVPGVAAWARHHRLHHRKGYGGRFNFSTVVPPTDALLATRTGGALRE